MKTTITLLILFTLFSPNIFAQDYSQWGLPEGATARLGKGIITSNIAYSPDGTRLAVAGSIGIWIYNAQTYQEIALLTGHTGRVTSIAFSPDGSVLSSGSQDNTVRVWDTVTGEHRRTLTGHTSVVQSVAFSPDGRTLASGSGHSLSKETDSTVRLWNAVTGEHKGTLTGHTDWVNSIVFSPDGGILASSGGWRDNTIRLWDAVTGEHKRTLTGHTDKLVSNFGSLVPSIAFSPDGGRSQVEVRIGPSAYGMP